MVGLEPVPQRLLTRLHAGLAKFYGERLCQTMLFGSYARGEAGLGSPQ